MSSGLGGSAVYSLTLDYEAGFDFVPAWASLYQRGAEECMKDSSLEEVHFRIEDVPEPRPSGWANGALADTRTCDELEDGYPYR